MPTSSIRLFASAVTDEFGSYRKALVDYLERPGVRVEEQRKFIRNGFPILTELEEYIKSCDAVIHLLGERSGNESDHGIPGDVNLNAILQRYPDIKQRLQISDSEIREISFTQWEALFAIYHNKPLFIASAKPSAVVDKKTANPAVVSFQQASQQQHAARLKRFAKYTDLTFESPHHLVAEVYRVLYDILPRPGSKLSPTPQYRRGR